MAVTSKKVADEAAGVRKGPKKCTSKVRVVAEVKNCDHPYRGEFCPKRDEHLYTVLSGFCNSGWHEGDKAKTAGGKPAPTCKSYINCPCKCHADLNLMFQMSGRERILVDNSDFKIPRTFIMPTIDPVPAAEPIPSIDGPAIPPQRTESPAPGIVPVAAPRTFSPTATGRAAKGELESWVREVTDIWAVERDFRSTPMGVALQIGKLKGIKPPSDGAVAAVFNRWEKMGFATFEKKPYRFSGYTEKGIELGLDRMKQLAKGVTR